MKPFLAFLLTLLGVAGYFVTALGLGIFQRTPWVEYGIAGAGVVLAAALLRRKPGVGRAVAAIGAAGLFGLFIYFTQFMSVYPTPKPRLGPGDLVPEATLADQDGRPFAVREEFAKPKAGTLLVFYRGFW
jgi:hypothetical protein